MIILFWLFILVLVGYSAGLFYLYRHQRRLLYFPTFRDSKAKGTIEFKPWNSADGTLLGYARECHSPKKNILFFHGNAGEALDRSWLSELFPDEEFSIYLVEYPGYGPCQGISSETTLFERADLALKEIQRLSQQPIILLGESLGSGPASYLASKNPTNTKLALVSPFTSAVELASGKFPFLPVKWMMKDKYENQKYLSSSHIPLHVVHATLDTTIPLDMGKKLFEGYQGKSKAMTIIPGYDHSNIPAAIVDSPLAEDFRNFILN